MDNFKTKQGRLAQLRAEQAGHDDGLKQADAAVHIAKAAADESRIAAIVDPSLAPAAAKAEAKLEEALEARDRLQARGGDLAAAVRLLEAELNAAASTTRATALEVAVKEARDRIKAARPVLEQALSTAATLWALEKRGPLVTADLGLVVAVAAGVDLEALRNAGLAEFERIRAEAAKPLRILAEGAAAATPVVDDLERTRVLAQHLASPSHIEPPTEI